MRGRAGTRNSPLILSIGFPSCGIGLPLYDCFMSMPLSGLSRQTYKCERITQSAGPRKFETTVRNKNDAGHDSNEKRPDRIGALFTSRNDFRLEHVPEELVVHLVVELNFGSLDERAKCTRAAVGGGLFQICVAVLYTVAEDLRCPRR